MTLLLLSVALSVLAGSLAWMAVILKRACCAWVSDTWTALLDGCAREMRI